MIVKLENVCERGSSNLKMSDVVDQMGKYPVYGASGYIGSVDFYHQEDEYVAVVKDGAGIGRAMLLPAKSSVIGTMQYLLPKENIIPKYLYYVVKYMHLEKYFSGATIPHIYFKDYKNEKFNLEDLEKQEIIVNALSKIESIIEQRQQELDKLDELIKARFVEMFGDIYDEEKWDRKAWNDVVIIQNGRDYKKVAVENGGYPVFGTGGEMARASDYLCPANAIVVGRKGSINNPLLVKEKFWNVDTAFGVIPNEHVLNYLYFYEFCRNFDFMKLNKATTLPSTTKADLLKISINVPPIELQNQFADFVKQVDKSKVVVRKALDEAQLLFDSLMQEYFG